MKMHRRLILLLTIVFITVTLGGCWDAKELDDLAIPLVAACDLAEESEKEYPNDKYLTTVGVPVFYRDVKENFHIIDTPGQMIGESRERRNEQLGEEVILGQLQLLVIGEELGKKENLLEITDSLTRNPRVKASLYILISKGRAVDLLKRPVHSYPNVGTYLKSLQENNRKTIFSPYTTLMMFNRDLISYESSAILPHVAYDGGEIRLVGSCLVNNGKVAGELGIQETETAVFLRGIKCRGHISFDAVKDGKVIDRASFGGTNARKVKVRREGDKYIFDIKIILKGVIVEHEKQIPMQDGIDLLEVFQNSLEQHIKERAEALVEKTQKEFKFDALHLANYIKAYTREKLTKEDIDRIVQEAEINVDVEVQIKNAGGKM